MAAICAPGMERAARAWVSLMLPEPIRPTWVVMGRDRMIRNSCGWTWIFWNSGKRGEGFNTEFTEVGAQRAQRNRASAEYASGGVLKPRKRRPFEALGEQDRRTPKWG